jgi:hypothetical protein
VSKIKLQQFGGQLPAWDPHLLPEGQADVSLNGYLYSGALTGWRLPKLLRALNNSAATFVYRVPTIAQSVAVAYLAFKLFPADGNTVKIGPETYTFTVAVTNAYDVSLDVNSNVTANNLLQALLGTGTPGLNYGTGTVINPVVSLTAGDCSVDGHDFGSGTIPVLRIKASDFGAAFNTIPVLESTATARLVWIYDLLSLSHTTTTLQGGTNQTFDNSITGAAAWLEFVDPDTNVMRSPVVDDKFGRYYFASSSQPPQYSTYDRIQAGQPPWLLGVPAPGCAPGVDVVGGGDLAQLGYPASVSANVTTPGANTLFLLPITPTGALILNDVALMPEATSTTAQFVAVLYSDNAGAPSELLNFGAGVTGCVAGTQVLDAFVNPTGLLANVKYWIGFLCSESIAIQKANDLAGTGVVHLATFSNGAPSFAPTMTTGQPNWQMWGDLTNSSILEARSYVYTWVTAYSEEGPPSPPTLVNGWSSGTWTIDLFTPSPDEMGVTRDITTTRIYRTVSAANGQTTYFLVAEVPVVTASYVDIIDDSVVALNTIMPSSLWFEPPEGLQGILSMPNGMAVGFKGNEIWFCEPYRPHAWPPSYVITTEFPIVGLGVTGNAVVACTNGTPYVAAGTQPGSMASTKILNPEPCVSRGSILSTDAAVYYMSPNGLVSVTGAGQVANTTDLWITREKWRALTPQKNARAILLASSYFAFGTVFGTDHSVAQNGFTIELANDTGSFTIWPQPGGHRVGFMQLSAPGAQDIYNVEVDQWTGIGLLIQNGNVYYYDFSDTAPTIQPYKWRSKVYQQKYKQNFEAVKVYFTVPPNTPAQNAVPNTAPTNDTSWNTLQTGQYGILRVYADGNLVTTREIVRNGGLLRILSGFKYEEWQFEVEGRVLVSNIQAATSVKELGTI